MSFEDLFPPIPDPKIGQKIGQSLKSYFFELTGDFPANNLKKGEIVEVIGEPQSQIVVTKCGKTVPVKLLKPTKSKASLAGRTPTAPPIQTLPGAGMSGAEVDALADALKKGRTSFGDLDATVDEDVTSDIPIEPPPRKLKKYERRLTDFTDGRLPESGVDHIFEVYKDSHFPKDIRCDIPNLNPHWYWDADVLETLIMGHLENETTLLVGYPGTGKSDGALNWAAILRQPFMRIGCRGDMETMSLMGYTWAGPKGMEFKEGLVPQGMRHGYIIDFDEVMKMPAHIAMACQELWESNSRRVVLDEKPGTKKERTVEAHDDCRIYCTDNVCGTGDKMDMFAATQIQDTSSLDRYGFVCRTPYLPIDVEVNILAGMYPLIKNSVINDIVKLAGLIRSGYENGKLSVTCSMRGLKAMCKLITRGFSPEAAANRVYKHKLGTDTEVQVFDQNLATIQF